MAVGGRDRGAFFLLASLVGAFAVTYMIWSVIERKGDALVQAQRPDETVGIVVAARDIPPGLTITTDDLQKRDLPEIYIPDEVFRTPEEVVGRVAMERVLQGEFIREERLADPEAGVGLNAIIPRGMRAISVDVKDASAVSGFLNPGNFVDVVGTFTDAEKPSTRTLLRAVTVLAVNDRLVDAMYIREEGGKKKKKGKKKGKPSVTLAVTPEQAELLTHAVDEGEITLALRNDIDVTNIDSNDRPEPTDIGPAPAPAPKPPRPASNDSEPSKTTVIRGGAQETIRNRGE